MTNIISILLCLSILFAYVLEEFYFDYGGEQGKVVTREPYIVETTAEFNIPLITAVFSGVVTYDRWHTIPWRQKPRPVKEIRLSARVCALRYGGGLFTYGGIIDMNPPEELPLKILEWRIWFERGVIRYESGRDAYGKMVVREICAAPSAYEVCVAEDKPWPQEPYIEMDLERFYFRLWLKDRSLTLNSVRSLYEAEMLEPYRQAMARYQAELNECERYYNQWLEREGVLLVEPEEIWDYLQNEELPETARKIEKESEVILKKAGHL